MNWGDGSAIEHPAVVKNIATLAVTSSISHVYADNGAYTVTVSVSDGETHGDGHRPSDGDQRGPHRERWGRDGHH